MWQDVVGVQTYILNFEPLDRLLSLGAVVILGGIGGWGLFCSNIRGGCLVPSLASGIGWNSMKRNGGGGTDFICNLAWHGS